MVYCVHTFTIQFLSNVIFAKNLFNYILIINSWCLYIHLNQGLLYRYPSPLTFPLFFYLWHFFSWSRHCIFVVDMTALDNIHTTYNYTSSINIIPLYLLLLFCNYDFYLCNTVVDIAAYQSVGPSLLSYPNPFKFFILFLCYVTVRLTALQFISLSVTLLNHYPHLLYV